jgi:Dyp-type peroxidase family
MAENAKEVAGPAEGALPLRMSENIQGNILAPFNKPCQRFIFISFCNRQPEAQSWLAQLVRAGVASTSQVVEYGEARSLAIDKDVDLEPRQWVGVSLTSSGLVTLHPQFSQDLVAYEAFWQGPLVDRESRGERRISPAVVGDVRRGDPTDWVVGGPRQYPVDAVLTVAADDQGGLEERAEAEQVGAKQSGLTVLSWQDCQRLDRDGRGIEPFGFRDGISQPGIRGFTAAEDRFNAAEDRNGHREAKAQPGTPIIAAGAFVLGYDGEGGSYPDARRPVPPDWMRDGSFQVFLRLRQDVEGWRTQMRELSESFTDRIDVAAKAIGRTMDGEPLAAPGTGGEFNGFTYEGDQDGQQTPRFAHSRKMNPRNGTFDDRIHRLLRRGIPFETPLHVETRLPGDDHIAEQVEPAEQVERGLAFNAFMASIENQFEFLQQRWASNPESLPPVAPDGTDPVVGAIDAPCVLRRANAKHVEIHFGRFVWTSGAIYAFAPSLSALHRLARLDPVQVEGA